MFIFQEKISKMQSLDLKSQWNDIEEQSIKNSVSKYYIGFITIV